MAMFEGNLLTPGQGALELIMSLINDLEITQLPFDLSCAISLFYKRTKIELNSVAPLYLENCLKVSRMVWSNHGVLHTVSFHRLAFDCSNAMLYCNGSVSLISYQYLSHRGQMASK